MRSSGCQSISGWQTAMILASRKCCFQWTLSKTVSTFQIGSNQSSPLSWMRPSILKSKLHSMVQNKKRNYKRSISLKRNLAPKKTPKPILFKSCSLRSKQLPKTNKKARTRSATSKVNLKDSVLNTSLKLIVWRTKLNSKTKQSQLQHWSIKWPLESRTKSIKSQRKSMKWWSCQRSKRKKWWRRSRRRGRHRLKKLLQTRDLKVQIQPKRRPPQNPKKNPKAESLNRLKKKIRKYNSQRRSHSLKRYQRRSRKGKQRSSKRLKVKTQKWQTLMKPCFLVRKIKKKKRR